jgi:hypothetical protein
LIVIEQGEVVEGLSDVGVLRAERLLADGKGALVERLGLRVAALADIELGEVFQGGSNGGMLRWLL